jgi:hypothetical protein
MSAFILCAECLAKYRALEFDPAGRPGLCHIPFNSLVWQDEHHRVDYATTQDHARCLGTVMALITARKRLWHTGRVPTEDEPLWREAQEVIPDWPGFRRLKLNALERQYLDQCETETDSMMEDLVQRSSVFAVEPHPGSGVRFVAHPRQGARPGDSTLGQ